MRPAIILAAALLASPATAAPPGVSVTDAWSRPATGVNGAGFMTLTNRSSRAATLVAASSPAAARVEFHTTTMSGGMASMEKLSNVSAPAGGTVLIRPGGKHLMLMGLKRPLKAGDRFPVTLTFASGAKVEATFTVGLSAPAAGHAHH
ncbi:MAG: copper chaperone PCu(A)C [Phenylobacterium sp.]